MEAWRRTMKEKTRLILVLVLVQVLAVAAGSGCSGRIESDGDGGEGDGCAGGARLQVVGSASREVAAGGIERIEVRLVGECDGKGVAGEEVLFEMVGDGGGSRLSAVQDVTDAEGVAGVELRAGEAEAEFMVWAHTSLDEEGVYVGVRVRAEQYMLVRIGPERVGMYVGEQKMLGVRAVEAATYEPVSGVVVRYWLNSPAGDGRLTQVEVETDGEGLAWTEFWSGTVATSYQVVAEAEGLRAGVVTWWVYVRQVEECVNDGDCSEGVCEGGKCVSEPCEANSCETLGVLCGRWEDGCGGVVDCGVCSEGVCQQGVCVVECEPRGCVELGVECGRWGDGCGGVVECGECGGGEACNTDGMCVPVCDGHCSDGVQNCGEEGVDCGGECEPCGDPCEGHCTDGVQNCGETGVDCGGECGPCGECDGVEDGTECGDRYCEGLKWMRHTCVGGTCSGTEQVADCDDGNVCTNDACSGAAGCSNVAAADGTECGDRYCDGLRWMRRMCIGGACGGTEQVANCDDGNVCTDDACSGAAGCSNVAGSGHCTDGVQNCGEEGVDCGTVCGSSCCSALSCGPNGILCGSVPDGCGGMLDCGACCGGCTQIVDDPLNGSSTAGQVNGGRFLPEGGWQGNNPNNRIVYDLGGEINCGRLEVDVRNFNPPEQFIDLSGTEVDCSVVDCYVHFLSLYRGSHGNHHQAASNCESQLAIQATGLDPNDVGIQRHRRFKLKAATTGWDGGGNNYSKLYTWNVDHIYRLRLEWNSEEVVLTVDGQLVASVELSWPCDEGYQAQDSPQCTEHNGRRLGFRYFFLGRDKNTAGGYLRGPVYSNVKIFECNP